MQADLAIGQSDCCTERFDLLVEPGNDSNDYNLIWLLGLVGVLVRE